MLSVVAGGLSLEQDVRLEILEDLEEGREGVVSLDRDEGLEGMLSVDDRGGGRAGGELAGSPCEANCNPDGTVGNPCGAVGNPGGGTGGGGGCASGVGVVGGVGLTAPDDEGAFIGEDCGKGGMAAAAAALARL